MLLMYKEQKGIAISHPFSSHNGIMHLVYCTTECYYYICIGWVVLPMSVMASLCHCMWCVYWLLHGICLNKHFYPFNVTLEVWLARVYSIHA